MSEEDLTATNDEIYLLLRQTQQRAESVYGKASDLATGEVSGDPGQEAQENLSEISPGADNWAIYHDLRQLAETLTMVERILSEALAGAQ